MQPSSYIIIKSIFKTLLLLTKKIIFNLFGHFKKKKKKKKKTGVLFHQAIFLLCLVLKRIWVIIKATEIF